MPTSAKTATPSIRPSPDFMPMQGYPRAWTAKDLSNKTNRESIFVDLDDRVRDEIAAAVHQLRIRKVNLQTIEQEDFRAPSFAKHVKGIREQLDHGLGIVVLRGIDVVSYTRDELDMVYWGIGNYIGRVMRQNLSGEYLDRVIALPPSQQTDPYRLIDQPVEFRAHTDNGFLEPRSPYSLGLLCLNTAKQGGESIVISAYTLHNVIREEHPEYLPRLYQTFNFDLPLNQRLPDGRPWIRPVFEWDGRDLTLHYIRYYIDPGMEKAGTPLSANEKKMFDYIDSVLQREELQFRYKLEQGEALFNNNLASLHGRLAFEDYDDPALRRELRRLWLWRRHGYPGADPVALDEHELGFGERRDEAISA
jgi:hypothetical protein